MNSNNLYNKPLTTSNRIIILIAIISFLGFIDASYLAAKYYLGGPIPCSILDGCDTVTTSKYSAMAGVPVALMGAIYYLIIFVLAISYLESKKSSVVFFISRFTIVGFLASLWFVYLQVFVLKALCLYCLFSALTSTALFVISSIFIWRRAVTSDVERF